MTPRADDSYLHQARLSRSLRRRDQELASGKVAEMNSLTGGPVAQILERLHRDAEAADCELVAAMTAMLEAPGVTMDTVVAKVLAREKDYRASSSEHVERFLAVSPAYGRLHDRARLQGGPDRRVRDLHGDLDHLPGRRAPG
jgi:hypothetical protein